MASLQNNFQALIQNNQRRGRGNEAAQIDTYRVHIESSVQQPEDGEQFQQIVRRSGAQGYRATQASRPARRALSDVTDELEAAVASEDRLSLIDRFIILLNDPTSHSLVEGSFTFRDQLAACNALDDLLTGFLASSSTSDFAPLFSLLTAASHKDSPPLLPRALAKAVIDFGHLRANGVKFPIEHAEKAVKAALTLIKSGTDCVDLPETEAQIAARISPIREKINQLEAALRRSNAIDEEMQLLDQLVQLYYTEADIIQKAAKYALNSHPDQPLEFILRPLQSFQNDIYHHLQILSDLANDANLDSHIAAIDASFADQHADLAVQLGAAEARIAELTRQLNEAKALADGIRESKRKIRDEHRARVLQLEEFARDAQGNAAKQATELELGIGSLEDLQDAVREIGVMNTAVSDGMDSDDTATSSSFTDLAEDVGAPAKLIHTATRLQEATARTLLQYNEKANFYRRRIAHATRQHQQLGILKDTKAMADVDKQRFTMEASLQQLLGNAESAARKSLAVADRCRSFVQGLEESDRRPPPASMERLATLASLVSDAMDELRHPSKEGAIGTPLSSPEKKAGSDAIAVVGSGGSVAAGQRRVVSPVGSDQLSSKSTSTDDGQATPESATVDSVRSSASSSEFLAMEKRVANLQAASRLKEAEIAAAISRKGLTPPSPLVLVMKRSELLKNTKRTPEKGRAVTPARH